MTKFSKGDEIECISSLGRIGLGEKFIVINSRPQLSAPSFHPEIVYIEVDGFVRSYSPKHFELVKEGGNNVSRCDVVNAKEVGSSPPNSPWFNGKYQVNPETSKLLQEAVFKDGGRWSYPTEDVAFLDRKHLYVDKYGNLTWGDDGEYFNNHHLPEKKPPKAEAPQPKGTPDHILDTLSTCVAVDRDENDHQGYFVKEVVTGKPEHTLVADLSTCVTVDKDRKMTVQLQGTLAKVMIDLTKQTEEKQTMSNKTNRRVLNIQLLDNDAGLPVEHALVAEFNGVVTEDNDQTTLQEIISTGEVAERIKVHNEVRSKQLDLAILKSTGQKVNLLPIKLKDLTWNIK